MVVTNMKELCEYSRQKKLARKHKHIELIKIHGKCSGLTDKEYKNSKVNQKSNFPQKHKYTNNRMWRDNIKKYSVEQLKTIRKT
tara:strand:+ start:93 stop:344 length:252 start_codon:yes stop_codon:yes gene_type:complete